MAQIDQNLPIEPELYQRTLEQLELQTVCLDEVKACCAREVTQDGQVDINLSAETEEHQTDNQYFAFITYRLRGQRGEDMLLEVEAKYRIVFDMAETIPKGFFEVFRELNLRITTMPYFRELVASITGRMEIPTLTLPYVIYAAPEQESQRQKSEETLEKASPRKRKPRVKSDN